MAVRNIIVVGGSTGALEALLRIVAALPEDFSASLFIAVHTSTGSPGLVDRILSRAGPLPARYASDGEPIRPGQIYIAPPDRHLLLKSDYVRVTRGPREHRFRPAVDPLFRTAAVAHRRRVIGVVLSGGQDDGAVGLAVIKTHGGIAVVQSPEDALAPGMPQAAIRHVKVDHVLGVDSLAPMLVRIAGEQVQEDAAMPRVPRDVAEAGADDLHHPERLGIPAPFTCPDCGGALWEHQEGELLQYRCHVGHRYSGDTLMSGKTDALDQALWAALRALEESSALWKRMAANARQRGMQVIASHYEENGEDSERQARIVRRVLIPEPEGAAEPVMSERNSVEPLR